MRTLKGFYRLYGWGGLPAVSWYLTIRSDDNYSQFAVTAPLVEFLAALPELRQTGATSFAATEGQPWIAVILAAADPAGNYAVHGTRVPSVNVVELVCSYFEEPEWYEALAARIAGYLGWSVFEDKENRQVYLPIEQRQSY